MLECMKSWSESEAASRIAGASVLTAASLTLAACQPPACDAISIPWAVELTVTLGDSWDLEDELTLDVECIASTTCLYVDQPEPATVGVWEGYLDEESSRMSATVTRHGEVVAQVPVQLDYLRNRGPCQQAKTAVAVVEDPNDPGPLRPLVPGADLLGPE